MWSSSSLSSSSLPPQPPPPSQPTAVKRMASIAGPFSIATSSPTMASEKGDGETGAKRPFVSSATSTRMADSMAGPSSFSSSARRPPSVTFLSSSDPATAAQPSTGSASTSVFNLAFTPSTSTKTKDNIFVVPRSRAPQQQQQQQLRTPLPPTPRSAATPRSITFPTPMTVGGGGQQTPRTGTGTLPRSRHSDNVIAAAVHGRGFAKNEVGLAAFNLTSFELHLCQMSDSHGFIKTIAKMNLFRPNEVLMPDTALIDSSRSLLADNIGRFDGDILLTSVNRGAFSDAVGIQFIQKLAVPDHLSVLHLVDQKYYALAAAAALLAHLENNLNLNFAPGTLRVFYSGTNQTAIVDSETSHRLELVSSLNPSGGPSLLSALNYCQTAAGSRLLRSNLLEPMTDLHAINQRLEAVEELSSRPTDFHHPVTEILGRFVDVERVVNQCIVTPKNPNLSFIEQRINAVIALKHILTLVPPLLQVLSKSRCSFLVALVKDLEQKKFEELLGKIQNVVDDRTKAVKGKMGQQKQRLNVIKKGVNLMLDVCRKTHCDLELKIEEYVEELTEKYQMPLTLSNTATRGYHLQQPCGRGRGSVSNANRQSSSSSRNSLHAAASTSSDHQSHETQLPPIFICVKRHGNYIAFTTQHLLVSNERIKAVQKDVEKITNVVLEDLLATIRADISSLYKLRDIVCQLDVVCSFAQVSFAGGFCRPSFGQHLLICDGRHPILNRFSPGALISNDTDVDEERNFVVITGANMSGKSTYIRQVMLLQIMSQIGCFVPASSASFRIVDQMFSRLCTHDRIENNASSFTLEMMEMNYIVRNADERSLVIVDELCRETSVDQGSAISWSLCEALMTCKAWVLIATHSPLITKMQDMYFNVANYHMEVIEEERQDGPPALNYTHKILPGVSTLENYGMKLACQAALPAQVLTRAEELIPILAAAIKPQPQVPFDFMMDKLNYSLNIRLMDVGRRMDSIPDASLRKELDHIRANYQQELSQLLADYGFSMSES